MKALRIRPDWHAITLEKKASATIWAWNIPTLGGAVLGLLTAVVLVLVFGLWTSLLAWKIIAILSVLIPASHYTKITVKNGKARKTFVTLWVPYSSETYDSARGVGVWDEDFMTESYEENDGEEHLSRVWRTYRRPDDINAWLDSQAKRLTDGSQTPPEHEPRS